MSLGSGRSHTDTLLHTCYTPPNAPRAEPLAMGARLESPRVPTAGSAVGGCLTTFPYDLRSVWGQGGIWTLASGPLQASGGSSAAAAGAWGRAVEC